MRPLFSGVCNLAVGVDDKKADGRRDIGIFHLIIDIIDEHGIFKVKSNLASVANFSAFIGRCRRFIENLSFEILQRLPAIRGVCFTYIDQKKFNVIFIRFINFIQSLGLITKGRSGIRAKTEGYRFSS